MRPPAIVCGFRSPADWAGHRVKLRFDAVYSKADVWINGTAVGSHLGAFTPFELDVTRAVLPGKENVLALAVASDSLADALTVGLEMVGHPMGGILRKVSHVRRAGSERLLAARGNRRSTANTATPCCACWWTWPTKAGKRTGGAVLHFSLRELRPQRRDGQPQSGQRRYGARDDPARPGAAGGRSRFPSTRRKNGTPSIRTCTCSTCDLQFGDQRCSIRRRFGFRQTEIRDGTFLLNGQPIRLRGMSRQDTHPLTGRTVSSAINKQDIEWMVWANCNNTYTCAFLPDEETLDLCDEAGPVRDGRAGHLLG